MTSAAYLCSFHDLEITGVCMDDVMQQPDTPDMEFMVGRGGGGGWVGMGWEFDWGMRWGPCGVSMHKFS